MWCDVIQYNMMQSDTVLNILFDVDIHYIKVAAQQHTAKKVDLNTRNKH